MVEKFGSEEIIEEIPRPNLLDIVKIDGKWAQVMTGGNIIRFLYDLSTETINWDDYQMVQSFKAPSEPPYVGGLIDKKIVTFTETEIQNIRWGTEEKDSPELKLQVKVFGEFEKK